MLKTDFTGSIGVLICTGHHIRRSTFSSPREQHLFYRRGHLHGKPSIPVSWGLWANPVAGLTRPRRRPRQRGPTRIGDQPLTPRGIQPTPSHIKGGDRSTVFSKLLEDINHTVNIIDLRINPKGIFIVYKLYYNICEFHPPPKNPHYLLDDPFSWDIDLGNPLLLVGLLGTYLLDVRL